VAESRTWTRFYKAAGDEPRETLLIALDHFDTEDRDERFAVDLGCGTGRDTAELLRRGWQVLAVDAQEEAVRRLLERIDAPALHRLDTQVARFEDCTLPEADLVNSSYALPFCPPEQFHEVWDRIVSSLRPGGRFSGQLFGDRDGWVGEGDITFLARSELEALLEGLEVEHLEEVEEDGRTAVGDAKHWHLFHLVVRKRIF
jgi:tellurite methyltransferase